jgi:hypothetical protein
VRPVEDALPRADCPPMVRVVAESEDTVVVASDDAPLTLRVEEKTPVVPVTAPKFATVE